MDLQIKSPINKIKFLTPVIFVHLSESELQTPADEPIGLFLQNLQLEFW